MISQNKAIRLFAFSIVMKRDMLLCRSDKTEVLVGWRFVPETTRLDQVRFAKDGLLTLKGQQHRSSEANGVACFAAGFGASGSATLNMRAKQNSQRCTPEQIRAAIPLPFQMGIFHTKYTRWRGCRCRSNAPAT